MKKRAKLLLAIVVSLTFLLTGCANDIFDTADAPNAEVPVIETNPTKVEENFETAPANVETSEANVEAREAADEENGPKEVVLADDECITATFEKLYDAKDLGIEGVFYIDINVENKIDRTIWVYLENASVNDEMVPLVWSGVPMNILPDKSGRNAFIFSFSALSIDTIDSIESIEFDLVVTDEESLEEIERVEQIELSF